MDSPGARVGILTFHDGINHGAFFQAYCLQRWLTLHGMNATLINYKNRTHWWNEYRAFLVTKKPTTLVRNLRKIAAFHRDQRAMRRHPDQLVKTRSRLTALTREYDFVIVGSDVVWDFEFAMTGGDPAYFGTGLEPKLGLISYAASMGRATSALPPELSAGLERFNHLSVRDENTRRILKEAGFDAVRVVDPTLLLDGKDIDIDDSPAPLMNDPYLLVYAFLVPEAWRARITRFARERGLQIVVAGYPQPLNALDRTAAGPAEWLALFRQANLVVTSTFHGTIFAMLTRRPFVTIANDAIENKAVSLLGDVGLAHRYVRGEFDATVLLADIDWPAVESRIAALRASSAAFLAGALDIEQGATA